MEGRTLKPVILLNAPPNAGKDEIAKILSRKLGLPHLEFKNKLFEIAKAISGLTEEQWDSIYTREDKEKPTELLFGLSPRQFMIKVSEEVIKPNFGKDYFGRVAAEQAYGCGGVFSDSGFNQEAEEVVYKCGSDFVFVVQFERIGCSFKGDSRDYLTSPHIKHYLKTTNNGTLEKITEEIINWVSSHYEEDILNTKYNLIIKD